MVPFLSACAVDAPSLLIGKNPSNLELLLNRMYWLWSWYCIEMSRFSLGSFVWNLRNDYNTIAPTSLTRMTSLLIRIVVTMPTLPQTVLYVRSQKELQRSHVRIADTVVNQRRASNVGAPNRRKTKRRRRELQLSSRGLFPYHWLSCTICCALPTNLPLHCLAFAATLVACY